MADARRASDDFVDETRPIAFRGVVRTIGEWADSLGVSPKEIFDRIFKFGWTRTRALTEGGLHSRKAARYTHEGRCLTISEWARELGTNSKVLNRRLRRWKDPATVFAPAPVPRARMRTPRLRVPGA